MEVSATAHHPDIVVKAKPRAQLTANVGHVHAETAVAHNECPVRVKKTKALLDRFNRVREVRAGAFGFEVRRCEARVGFVQKVERMFEVTRTFADLLFQKDRTLELGICRAAVVVVLFDTLHQRITDFQQLISLPFNRFR